MLEQNDSTEAMKENADGSQPCCSSVSDSGDCCSSGSGSSGKSWKIAIFVVVMLLAGVVAAHSLLTRSGETQSVSDEAASSFGTLSLPDEVGSSTEAPTTGEQPSEAVAAVCGITLDSIKSLPNMAAEKKANVAFIFLAGEDEVLARTASARIEAVVGKLSAQGKPVVAFTLKKGAEGYDQLIRRFSVQSLPCVIVTGRGCGAAAVSGEITETRLLAAFVRASTPLPSCGPRKGSPCCPAVPAK